MINRVLIRTRAMQIAYANYHHEEQKLTVAEADLRQSLQRTYDLYLYLLRLPLALSEKLAQLQEIRSHKHLATESERRPNLRLQSNQLRSLLEESSALDTWYKEFPLAWENEQSLLRHLVESIEASSIYQEYLESPESSFVEDKELWVQLLQQVVFPSHQLAEYLEEQSMYWDNELRQTEKLEIEERPEIEEIESLVQSLYDTPVYVATRLENSGVEVVKDFVLKSLRHTEAEHSFDEVGLLPIYKDPEDERFATHLLRQLLLDYKKHEALIDKHISQKWERERLATLDLLLIQLAIVEFLHFPAIPTSVSINEYIELSKNYSTPKSAAFINGVLDAIASELKSEGKILKA